jgi:hypothetical protein
MYAMATASLRSMRLRVNSREEIAEEDVDGEKEKSRFFARKKGGIQDAIPGCTCSS